jgi:hypothetical protein
MLAQTSELLPHGPAGVSQFSPGRLTFVERSTRSELLELVGRSVERAVGVVDANAI